MSPDLIGNGPDDIVIYLNKTLRDSEVPALVGAIQDQDRHNSFLCDSTPPLGKEELGIGIFGADLPKTQKVGQYAFDGSHGMDRAKIVTHALEEYNQKGDMDVDFEDVLDEVLLNVGLNPQNPAHRIS